MNDAPSKESLVEATNWLNHFRGEGEYPSHYVECLALKFDAIRREALRDVGVLVGKDAEKFLEQLEVTPSPERLAYLKEVAAQSKSAERPRERDEAAEKAKGQLDIIQRECEGEDEAFLANDYGGTGWEREAPVTTVREIRQAAEKLAEAVETALGRIGNTWAADELRAAHTAWREREGQR